MNQDQNMSGFHEPSMEQQREFAQQMAQLRAKQEALDAEESTRKPVTIRMKLRDLARLKGLARKLDTKYQTLMLELVSEGLARREAEMGITPRRETSMGTSGRDPVAAFELLENLKSITKELEANLRATSFPNEDCDFLFVKHLDVTPGIKINIVSPKSGPLFRNAVIQQLQAGHIFSQHYIGRLPVSLISRGYGDDIQLLPGPNPNMGQMA